jgi:ABC-type phosphate/phosphonate transport system substrate-binding protein
MMIGCTRMYNVNAAVADLWQQLLETAAAHANMPMEVIAHPAPAPLEELWARSDMLCAFMCGWPFRRSRPPVQIVAAPIPASGSCEGPYYCTDMIVRADAPFARIEDTFGGRIVWTDEGSHSGFNAPRRLLLNYAAGLDSLYTQSIGPVVTPRASLNAVIEGQADIAPLDSYFHMLLKQHEPDVATQVRILARTSCAPIPVLVAAPGIPPEQVARLGTAFEALPQHAAMRSLLEELCLLGFARVPNPERYALIEKWADEAMASGYIRPG